MKKNGNSRALIPAVLTAAVMAAAGLSGCGAQGAQTIQIQGEESQNQVVVTGQDKVTAVPDMAEIAFAVRTRRPRSGVPAEEWRGFKRGHRSLKGTGS